MTGGDRVGGETCRLEIVVGCLLLAAAVIPVMSRCGETTMTWDVIRHGSGKVAAFLVGMYAIGLAVVLLVLVAKGTWVARGHLALGMVGAALLAVACLGNDSGDGFIPDLGVIRLTALLAGPILLVTLIVALALRQRLDPRPALRLAQGLAAALLGALTLAGLFWFLGQHRTHWGPQEQYARFDLLFYVGVQSALAAACALALVGAAWSGGKWRALSKAATALLVGMLLAAGVYLVLRLPIALETPAFVLPGLHLVIYCGSILVLLCRGLIRTIAHGAAMAASGIPEGQ